MIAGSNILQLCMLEFSIIGLYVICDCKWRFSMIEKRTRLFIHLLNKFHHECFSWVLLFMNSVYEITVWQWNVLKNGWYHLKSNEWIGFISLSICVSIFLLLFDLNKKIKVSFCASLSCWYLEHHCHHHYRFVIVPRKRACSQNIIIVCIAVTFRHLTFGICFCRWCCCSFSFFRAVDEESSTMLVNRFLLRIFPSCFRLRSGRPHSKLKFSRQIIIAVNCFIYRPKLKTLFELIMTTMIY